MEENWDKESVKNEPKFLRAVIKTFGKDYAYIFFVMWLKALPLFPISVIIGLVIEWFEDDDAPMYVGFVYVLAIFILMVISNLAFHNGLVLGFSFGNLVKTTGS